MGEGFTINGIVPGSGSCVAGDCGARIARGRLMCGDHWASVPAHLQSRVSQTLDKWIWGSPEGGTVTLADVREVQQAAADHVDNESASERPPNG